MNAQEFENKAKELVAVAESIPKEERTALFSIIGDFNDENVEKVGLGIAGSIVDISFLFVKLWEKSPEMFTTILNTVGYLYLHDPDTRVYVDGAFHARGFKIIPKGSHEPRTEAPNPEGLLNGLELAEQIEPLIKQLKVDENNGALFISGVVDGPKTEGGTFLNGSNRVMAKAIVSSCMEDERIAGILAEGLINYAIRTPHFFQNINDMMEKAKAVMFGELNNDAGKG